jgi:2,4-dienoyl-CoA reductase (NADPH2)
MSEEDIQQCIDAYVRGARMVREAGFDGVEVHGGTGYLLVQFLSPRTNLRTDDYGGSLENRMRFPLQVMDRVREAVGPDYPVGYRFLAEEYLEDGLHPDESLVYAEELARRGVAYLSVMGGTYDSFFAPEYSKAEKHQGFMVGLAEQVKQTVPETPVIAAGRIQYPDYAEEILVAGKADLIGLARVLFADPLWPRKAAGEVNLPIVECEPSCWLCMKKVMGGRPAFCSQWPKERRDAFREATGQAKDEEEEA